MKISLVILIILFALSARAEFRECAGARTNFTYCKISIGKNKYSISPPINGEVAIQKNSQKWWKVKTKARKRDELLVVYLAEYQDLLLFAYTYGDMETGASAMMALSAKDGHEKWTASIPGPNLSLPVITNENVLVSSKGFIGNIELSTGEYKYKDAGLYLSHKFNGNAKVDITYGEPTVFIDDEGHKITVNAKTGKVLTPRKEGVNNRPSPNDPDEQSP